MKTKSKKSNLRSQNTQAKNRNDELYELIKTLKKNKVAFFKSGDIEIGFSDIQRPIAAIGDIIDYTDPDMEDDDEE